LAVLLRKLESFPDVIVAVEVTSLEDAYLKIVRSEDAGIRKDDEQIQNEVVMDIYQATTGNSSFCGQYRAMFSRRFTVFRREPR
jgi:hypothetical protein